MVWSTTTAVEEFLADAGEFLRAEPARNSVVLTVTEKLRVKAACAPPSMNVSATAYQRLGYRPVEDRVVMSFAPAT
jgi:hypothetical protein